MVAYGVDQAWDRLSPAQLLAVGKTFVIGYVGQDTTGKNITRAEVDAYRAAGIAVLLVYEYSATAVHGGVSAGAADADLAVRQAQALGYPPGCAIAFAVDEDTTPNPAIVYDYAHAFTARVRAAGYRSMVYGGLATVGYCLVHGLVDLAWQTYAWSGGVWDPRAAIRQVRNGVTIAGMNVDLDIAMTADYGAWAPGTGADDMTSEEHNLLWAAAWLAQGLAQDVDTISVPAHADTGYPGFATPNLAKQARQQLAAAVAKLPAAAAPTQDQVTAAVTAVMNDTVWLAKLASALAAHVKVS